MIPYILYTAIILTGCFIFYKLLLQKETFFRLNRLVLLSCMLLSFLLPLLPVPEQFSFRKATVAEQVMVVEAATVNETANPSSIKSSENVAAAPATAKSTIDSKQVMQWLVYLYWFGVIVFGLNFLLQAGLLLYTAYSRPVIKDGRFRIVEIAADKAPCSFGNNIFINPEKYEWEIYNQVLQHEKIHIEQGHTFDLLLAEIVLVFQWFNPFAWQWRKELETNLEFFTDEQMLLEAAIEKEAYQMSLLKVAAPHFPLSLTTNYNQSLLKKRLIMMNAKKSNVHTAWKYFFLLPLMVLFVCLFNKPVANSQNLTHKGKAVRQKQDGAEMQASGSWFATIKGDKVDMHFKNDADENSNSNSSFLLSEFSAIPKEKETAFTLTRECGTMHLTGRFEGNNGMGHYQFSADKNYIDAMGKEGIDVSAEQEQLVYFLLNIKTSYAQMLKKNGFNGLDNEKLIPLTALNVSEEYISSIKEVFPSIDLENLVPFKALGIDKAYIEEIRNAGYKDLSPDKIISFKAQGIDGKLIADYRITTGYKKNLNGDNAGNRSGDTSDIDGDDIIAFKSMNIDKVYINSFKAIGYDHISNEELITMKSLGVTSDFVKSFQAIGYKNISVEDLVGFKSLGVTAALVKEYKDLGFAEALNLEDITGAKATGTTPAFIKSMRAKGHKLKSLGDYIAMKTVVGN